MTREEAIKELNNHYDTTDEVWLDFPKLKEALERAISALSEIKSEWIPISERLPEKNVWVLGTVEQNDNRYQEIMRRNVYTGEWTDNIDNYTDEITAWMSLPEPYKVE